MNLKHRISKHLFGRIRNKRKKRIWNYIWIVLSIAACDVLILFVLFEIFLPMLLETTPYLLPEHSQEYSYVNSFLATNRPVTALEFSPDGKTLAHGMYTKILLLDIETGKQQYNLSEHDGVVTSLAFSPDGKTLVSSSKSNQNSVILYDTTTGDVKSNLYGHSSWITNLDYSPDGKTIVGASENGKITAWETSTGISFQPILGTFAFTRPLIDKYYEKKQIIVRWNWKINPNNVGNTPDNINSVVKSKSFEKQGIIAMTPGPNNQPIFLTYHRYPVSALTFSPDGKILASGGRSKLQPFNMTEGKIHLWNVETGMPTITLRTPGWKVDTLAFSPNGKYLASDGSKRWRDSQKILIWDLTAYRLISMIDLSSLSEITALVFASDNKTLASGDERGKVQVWDITGETNKDGIYIKM